MMPRRAAAAVVVVAVPSREARVANERRDPSSPPSPSFRPTANTMMTNSRSITTAAKYVSDVDRSDVHEMSRAPHHTTFYPWLRVWPTREEFATQRVRVPHSLMGRLGSLEGAVGAGKTSFIEATKRAGDDNAQPVIVFPEDAHHCVIEAFCAELAATTAAALPASANGIPAMMQVWMHAHANQRRRFGSAAARSGSFVLLDRGEHGNYNFGSANYALGNITAEQFAFFKPMVAQPWYQGMDFMVYFDVCVETSQRRLRARQGGDASGYTDEYLEEIEYHNTAMLIRNARSETPFPVVIVPWDVAYGEHQQVLDAIADAVDHGAVACVPRLVVHDLGDGMAPYTTDDGTGGSSDDDVVIRLSYTDVYALAVMRDQADDATPYTIYGTPEKRRWEQIVTLMSTLDAKKSRTYNIDLDTRLPLYATATTRRVLMYLLARPDTREIHVYRVCSSTRPEPPQPNERT
jgi:thymidylate kinase